MFENCVTVNINSSLRITQLKAVEMTLKLWEMYLNTYRECAVHLNNNLLPHSTVWHHDGGLDLRSHTGHKSEFYIDVLGVE